MPCSNDLFRWLCYYWAKSRSCQCAVLIDPAPKWQCCLRPRLDTGKQLAGNNHENFTLCAVTSCSSPQEAIAAKPFKPHNRVGTDSLRGFLRGGGRSSCRAQLLACSALLCSMLSRRGASWMKEGGAAARWRRKGKPLGARAAAERVGQP